MLAKYFILAIYFLVLFLIGYLAARKVTNIKDYFVGGKALGFWVVAFSSRATASSAWALLGLTGMGAIFGIHALWVVAGTVAGECIAWFMMAKPFKRLTDQYDSITIPDYMVSRFKAKSHTLRILSATALSLFVVIYVSAQIDATGTAFETFLGWNYFTGAIVGFFIVVAYLFFGGFMAVAWSDVFQGTIMVLGLIALPIFTLTAIDLPSEIPEKLYNINPGLLNIWGSVEGFSFLNLCRGIGFLMIGLGYLGAPQLFVRFMAVKNEKELDKAKWVSVSLTLIMNVSAVIIGMLGRFLFTVPGADPTELLGNGGQNVLILLAESVMPVFLSGIYMAAVLSAIMSTVDSLLIVASSAVTRDFYQQVIHPDISEVKLSFMSRKVTFLLAILSLTIALTVAVYSPTRTIFWFVIFGWSGIAATFCPMILLSLFWKKYTEQGAIASMIIGFLGVIFFKFIAPTLPVIGSYFLYIAELFPSFLLATVAGVVVSLTFSRQQKIEQKTILR
jgi:sodium/proline symporter